MHSEHEFLKKQEISWIFIKIFCVQWARAGLGQGHNTTTPMTTLAAHVDLGDLIRMLQPLDQTERYVFWCTAQRNRQDH